MGAGAGAGAVGLCLGIEADGWRGSGPASAKRPSVSPSLFVWTRLRPY